MSELEDILVSGEFAAFRDAYAPAVRSAGPAEVRRTVRRRRRRAAITTAVVVALAVAIPVGANAALHGRPSPAPAESAEPTPSAPTRSPTPSISPPLSSTPTPSTVSPTAAPDGRISKAQLFAAQVLLPPWLQGVPDVCLGNVRLQAGPRDDDLPSVLGDLGYGDLDRDGATETVALVACRLGEAQAKQVVAFDRDDHGRIVTLGRIVGTQDGMADITDLSVRTDGRIRVAVADIQPCCGTPRYWAQQQWRTYSWTGRAFTQTAGPTGFGRDPRLTDLAVTAGDLVLGPADTNGKRPGTVSVTVTNKGPTDVPRLGFGYLNSIGDRAGGDLTGCQMETKSEYHACLLPGLAAGQRRTYTFRFLVDPAQGDPQEVRVIHFDAAGRQWRDLNYEDNDVLLAVKF